MTCSRDATMIGRPLLLLLLLAGCANAPQGNAYQRGATALAKGDARTARVELLNALKDNPNDRQARLLQARTYLELGDGVAAQAEAERARALGAPKGATAPLVAHALLLQGQPEAALAAVGEQHGAYAERMRGRALAALGRTDEAGSAFDRAMAMAPKDDDLLTDVARFRRGNGELGGALAAADRAVAANPANGEALVLRGELTRGQYGLRAALPWFDRAIALDDDNVTARLERAATLGDLGAMHAMLAETRKVLARSADHPMAYYLQAMLAARARNFTLARSLYQRTQGRLDGQPAALLLTGAIEFAAGDVREAVDRLGQLVELQPDNIKARRMLAAAQWKSGDAAATVKTLRALADRDDADSYSLSLIGAALAKLGDREGASRYLSRAAWPDRRAPAALFDQALGAAASEAASAEASASPGDAGAQVRLIRALIAAGDLGQARDRAARLAADNAGAPDAHLLFGDVLALQGDYRGAAERYRRAANIAFTEPAAMRMIEALERSGQSEAASQVLELFLDQNPRSVPAQLLAAARLMQAHQWDDAVGAYESLRAEIGDSDAAVLNNLAQAYAQLGDYDAAIPIAHRAWRLDRGNSMAADTYGWLLYRSGRDKARGLVLMQQASRGGASEEAIRRRLEAARPRRRS
jgi:tetratricopeptide (TPR) repeat protein